MAAEQLGRDTNAPPGAPTGPDALIVVPPPSPSDTNPPLGPAILSTVAARRGFRVEVLDLNALVLSRFTARSAESARPPRAGRTLGDHGKDRAGVAAAAAWVFDNTGLRARPPLHLPDTADPVAGMHYAIPDIAGALATAARHAEPWRSWLLTELRTTCPRPPAVVGVSLMGPSQVFVGLLVLLLAKEIWPDTTTVLGGSHVSLLGDELTRDDRVRGFVDLVMPGHCEDAFASLLARLIPRTGDRRCDGPSVPGSISAPFEYLPTFSERQLSRYGPEWLTLPVQFTRGCSYGRCTFCTYPVVEPLVSRLDPPAARSAIEALVRAHGIRRFSLKDSLFTAPMLRAFAEALVAEPLVPIRWSATTKANRALVPLAPLLAAAGLTTVEIGVETISPAGQRIFDKRADPAMVRDLVLALTEQGITVVVNLIFGYPGERAEEAQAQLDWFLRLRADAPAGRIDCSLNMLEMVRGSPMVMHPPDGVHLVGVAPWAFSYAWNAPAWRREFEPVLRRTERTRPTVAADRNR